MCEWSSKVSRRTSQEMPGNVKVDCGCGVTRTLPRCQEFSYTPVKLESHRVGDGVVSLSPDQFISKLEVTTHLSQEAFYLQAGERLHCNCRCDIQSSIQR